MSAVVEPPTAEQAAAALAWFRAHPAAVDCIGADMPEPYADDHAITLVRAALAAPAEQPREDDSREHMRVQDAIEQRLRAAGYGDEAWFADVIDGAAEAALAARSVSDAPPVYLAADVWSALRLPDEEFSGYYERNGWAETWAVLMSAVRGPGRCGRDVDGEPCVLAPHSELTPCHGASDVGSSEPLPWPAAPADDTSAPVPGSRPRRLRACVEAWPEADNGGYDPRCCRFPKSCSASAYDPDRVAEDALEPLAGQPVRDSQDGGA